MTPVDLRHLEEQLGVSLPASYREFLTAYPADASAEVRRYDLFDDPDIVADETLVFRRYLAEHATSERLVVIGDGGCGDKACLDLASGAVLFWSHVEEDFVPLADSTAEYYAALAETV